MGRLDEIQAERKRLDEEEARLLVEERANVVAEVREKIKRFNITATELKGLLKGRVTQKQVEDFIKRKEAAKNKVPRKSKKPAK